MAEFDLNDPRDYMQACDYIQKGVENKWKVEIKRCIKKRTSEQRGYLHFLTIWVHCSLYERSVSKTTCLPTHL